MDIQRSGSRPSGKGPAEWFIGMVRIDPLFDAPVPARAAGASVTFEPGARTAWHTHPLGQTLIVTAGFGRAQRWGGPVEEIRPGDVLWSPPGEKHWHGASPTTAQRLEPSCPRVEPRTLNVAGGCPQSTRGTRTGRREPASTIRTQPSSSSSAPGPIVHSSLLEDWRTGTRGSRAP
jgi:quercetin dioxygenase-like cupin family protein